MIPVPLAILLLMFIVAGVLGLARAYWLGRLDALKEEHHQRIRDRMEEEEWSQERERLHYQLSFELAEAGRCPVCLSHRHLVRFGKLGRYGVLPHDCPDQPKMSDSTSGPTLAKPPEKGV